MKPTATALNAFSVMHCPVCSAPMRRLFEKQGCAICGCDACHHQSAEIEATSGHVTDVYGDSYFSGGGAGYSDYLSEGEILRRHGRRHARRLSRHMQPGTVLDIGAAAGFILRGFQDCGWRGQGLEPNERMAEFARTKLGLSVQVGSLEENPIRERFQLITLIQVIAHFYDVRRALEKAAAATEDGGWWLIETWNRGSMTARLFGRNWHEYSPPSVLHWFTPESLRTLAGQFGFREIAHGRPSKWLNGAHAKSLVRYKLGKGTLRWAFDAASRLVPDRLSIPYPAEDLFWMLLRRDGSAKA